MCQGRFTEAVIVKEEVHQVFDLPEVRAVVTEHRVATMQFAYGMTPSALFASEDIGPTCYGPGVRALLTYPVVAQHLPIERASEVVAECGGFNVSSGFTTSLIGEASEGLVKFAEVTRAAHIKSSVLHLDETWARVARKLGSVPSASTTTLTTYLFHHRAGPSVSRHVIPSF